jgi:predicted metalloprotease with PDZ domain
MAESAAAYLDANPGRRMVILCGAGHVEFGSGIPQRLARRTKATYAIVINSGEGGEDVDAHMADYLLLSKRQDLPPAGVLGVNLNDKDGNCRVGSLTPGGAGGKAGLRKGDMIVAIDGQTVKTSADARLALWEKKPGDRVRVEVRREGRLRGVTSLDFTVELAAQPKAPETQR